ncbi:YfhO family protein [Variovorax sp. HJSM1_2]|uniref:YfhO family protein n=1 Tax=Variovorax sp. HJSM1_2 TaxID=3366263 RepID=UPI003BDDE352
MEKNKFNWQTRIAEIAAIFAVWLLFLYKIAGEKYSFATHLDNEFFLAPILSHISEVLRHGEWPLWINTILGGIPLFNFAQLSPFYPFYFSFLPIFETPLEAMRSMHLITLMHIFIFLANSYILLRVLQVSRIAAIVGAVLIAFSSNSQNYAVWINITAPYAWLPLYLAGLIKVLEQPKSLPACMTMLFAIVMLTLASPAQPLIHAVVISVLLFLSYTLFLYKKNNFKNFFPALGTVSLIALIAILLTAPVLIPVVSDFKDMIRWVGGFPPVIGNDLIPFEAFLTDQVRIADIPAIFFKMANTQAVGGLFIGLIPIFLAIKSGSARKINWAVWPIIFLAIYSLLSSFGSNFGLAYVNYEIPLINKIREPSRFLFLFQFSVGLLAAFGIDQIIREFSKISQNPSSYWKKFFAGFVVLSIAFSLVIAFKIQDRGHEVALRTLIPLGLLIFGTIFLARLRPNFNKNVILSFWAALTIGAQWIQVPWIAPKISDSQFLATGGVGLMSALERIAEKDPNRQYRVVFEGSIQKQHGAMLASYLGLRTFNAYVNPAPYQQFKEIYYHVPRKDNYVRALGGKFLVCQDCTKESTNGYEFSENISGFSIYEAPAALPYTYIAQSINGLFGSSDDFADKTINLDLKKPVLFIEPGTLTLESAKSTVATSLCFNQAQSPVKFNKRIYSIQCDTDGVFVLNEFSSSSWEVLVDGELKMPLKVNGNQIGVPFKSGAHFIEFRYSPPIFKISLWFLFSGLLLLGIYIIALRRMNEKSSASAPA